MIFEEYSNLQKIFSSSNCLLAFKHFPHTEVVRSIIHLTPPTERRLWENLSLTQGDCQKGNTGMSFLNLGGRVAKKSSFAKSVIFVVSLSHSFLLLRLDWCDPVVWRCWVHASYPCYCYIELLDLSKLFYMDLIKLLHVFLALCQTKSS